MSNCTCNRSCYFAHRNVVLVQGPRTEAEGNEESEAGPEAVAAAQQAMQQYGQDSQDNPQGARHLEEMMNAMIEQAYDEDMEVALPAFHASPGSMHRNLSPLA